MAKRPWTAALESLKQEFDLMQLIDQAAAEMVDSDSTVVVDFVEGSMAVPVVESPVAPMVMEGSVTAPTVEGPMAEGLVAMEGPVATPGVKSPVSVEGNIADPAAAGAVHG